MFDWTEATRAAGTLQLAAMGAFHTGGGWVELRGTTPRELRLTNAGPTERTSLDGQYWDGGMYVQYFVPTPMRGACPLLLWHGGGLCGSFFETTPDGREGWQTLFLRQGWPVFNCDAVERGRSGWMPFEELRATKPILNARHVAFERFRIGAAGSFHPDPAQRKPYANTQFPVAAYDQFVRQQVPRWTDSDAALLAAYEQLVQEVPPSVVVAHSQGGQFALQAAMRQPERVRALVLVEPSGTCDPDAQQLAAMARIPMLVIYGDHLATDARWQTIRDRTAGLLARLRAAQAAVEVLELPQIGLVGNSHLIPVDRNNHDVAQLITQWLARHGLYRAGDGVVT